MTFLSRSTAMGSRLRGHHAFLVVSFFIAVVNLLHVHHRTTSDGATSLVLSSTKPIASLRSESAKLFAQRCTQAHRGGVYVKHNRKAGGSSLYAVLQPSVCPRNPVFSSELPFFDTQSFLLSNSTIFITSLRNPIDRIVSLYWFEGRWPRTCNHVCENNKTKDDRTKVADLSDWVESVYHQRNVAEYKLRKHSGCGLWQSVENYYTRQFLGVDRGRDGSFLNVTLTRDDLHRAKQVLASFDLVMIQERFSGKQKNNNMVRMFRTITGARTAGAYMPHARVGQERMSLYKRPTGNELRRLEELNQFDLELYEYAKQLSHRTVNEWVKREQSEAEEEDETLIEQCQPPPRTELPRKLAYIWLSGKGCIGRPFYYYSPAKVKPECLLHSGSK